MKLAILETGTPPAELIPRFGRYPAMFQRLLGPGFDYAVYDVAAGEMPEGTGGHDAWLITGSPAGVYENLPWIRTLLAFVRAADEARMVGICFGHQAMAAALGGGVEKSDNGWGVGLQDYAVVRRTPWMDEGASVVSVPASHQDQVVLQPPNTDLLVSSPFTPVAGLAWRDRPAASLQFHPEFEPDFARALIATRRDRLPDPDAAIASLARPNDNARVGAWIRNFLMR